MKLIGLLPVRNESWILGLSARVALQWNDELIIGLHACTDESTHIAEAVLAENCGRVHLLHQPDPNWDEMTHRQRLLEEARARGATHISIVDADECLCSNTLPLIRKLIEAMEPGQILRAPGYNLRGSLYQYHANGIWGNRTFSLAFPDDPRLSWSGDKFHSREPAGIRIRPYYPINHGDGGILHLWGASERRLRAKCAGYKVQERLRWPDKPVAEIDHMYSWAIHGEPAPNPHHAQYGTPATWTYAQVPEEWWAGHEDLLRHVDWTDPPYQEELVREAIAKHGLETFAGLDLFGAEKTISR